MESFPETGKIKFIFVVPEKSDTSQTGLTKEQAFKDTRKEKDRTIERTQKLQGFIDRLEQWVLTISLTKVSEYVKSEIRKKRKICNELDLGPT